MNRRSNNGPNFCSWCVAKSVIESMRFFIAIAFLTQGSLTASARERIDKALNLFGDNSPLHTASFDNPAQQKIGHRQGKHSARSRLSGRRKLNNARWQAVECDPTSTDADIGILSCGDDSLYLEDSKSTLGGFCVKSSAKARRHMEMKNGKSPPTTSTFERVNFAEAINPTRGSAYCDPSSPYHGLLDCNCNDFDLQTSTGSFQCIHHSYCFSAVSECCADTCGSITISYENVGDGTYSYQACYAFETPYQQTFCFGKSKNLADGTSVGCYGSFNGESCGACNEQNGCTLLDCKNTLLRQAVCVESFYPPVLTACYEQCSACTICPDGYT